MAYIEFAIDNSYGDQTGPRWTCGGCGNANTDVDAFYVSTLNQPFLCSRCLVEGIQSGRVVLSDNDDSETGSCDNCGDSLNATSDTAYCNACWENQYENFECEESHGCHWCGDDDAVYCYTHAVEQWELIAPDDLECEECNDNGVYAKAHYLCNDCFAAVTSPPDVTYAQAAEPIDVVWGDDDDN